MDEPSVEVGKSKERLDILHLAGFGPVGDGFDFIQCHCKTVGGEDIAKVFDGVLVELALFCFSEKVIGSETTENFADMLWVIVGVVGVNENVIKVGDNIDVEHVTEDVVDEALKSGRSVGESERHYKPFKGSISSAEGCFPFIAFCYAD